MIVRKPGTPAHHRFSQYYDSAKNELNLQDLNLSAADVPDICLFLKDHPNINNLNLKNNNIGDAGAILLARITTLKALNLRANNIGADGAKALADNSSLKWLNLRWNHIGDEGAIALSASASLEWLNLRWNHIGDGGGIALAANSSLRWLNLCENYLGINSAHAFARNTALIALDLSNNNMKQAEMAIVNKLATTSADKKALKERLRFFQSNPDCPANPAPATIFTASVQLLKC